MNDRFTMSLFVASLAFRDSHMQAQAILVASLVARVGGYLVLRFASRQPAVESG